MRGSLAVIPAIAGTLGLLATQILGKIDKSLGFPLRLKVIEFATNANF